MEDANGGKYEGYRTHYKWDNDLLCVTGVMLFALQTSMSAIFRTFLCRKYCEVDG